MIIKTVVEELNHNCNMSNICHLNHIGKVSLSHPLFIFVATDAAHRVMLINNVRGKSHDR
mgnify:CR=1 FL=1